MRIVGIFRRRMLTCRSMWRGNPVRRSVLAVTTRSCCGFCRLVLIFLPPPPPATGFSSQGLIIPLILALPALELPHTRIPLDPALLHIKWVLLAQVLRLTESRQQSGAPQHESPMLTHYPDKLFKISQLLNCFISRSCLLIFSKCYNCMMLLLLLLIDFDDKTQESEKCPHLSGQRF